MIRDYFKTDVKMIERAVLEGDNRKFTSPTPCVGANGIRPRLMSCSCVSPIEDVVPLKMTIGVVNNPS